MSLGCSRVVFEFLFFLVAFRIFVERGRVRFFIGKMIGVWF